MESTRPTTGAPPPQAAFPVVALAASAGGLNALMRVLGDLPSAFPAAVVVLQHLDPRHPSALAGILARHTRLSVKQAEEGDCLAPGMVYVAPPNWHLLVTGEGRLSLSSAAVVHFLRPSADLLFGSAARFLGPRVIAVVLTGTGSDGTEGVREIKKMGGKVIVQDSESAEYPGMPSAAIRTGVADRVVPLAGIAAVLKEMVGTGDAA